MDEYTACEVAFKNGYEKGVKEAAPTTKSKKRDSLGDRMKTNYENISRGYLTRRTPVIIRIDGKAFHTFTKGLKKPFDEILAASMKETMKFLCENIQGCVLGYTQSDEITLILVDYKNLDTSAWFDYNIQKVCSVAASMATLSFNKAFAQMTDNYMLEWNSSLTPQSVQIQQEHRQYIDCLKNKIIKGAMFDARCFNIPKEEVCNCLIWRQQDAIRNSIESVGQANFSHRTLNKKNCAKIKEMLKEQKNIIWENYPTTYKQGCCCLKTTYNYCVNGSDFVRTRWEIDNNIPLFSENRSYIENLVEF